MKTAFSTLECESRTTFPWRGYSGSSRNRRRFADLVNFTALVGVFAALIACSNDSERPPMFHGLPHSNTSDAGVVSPGLPIDCTTPNTGCACDQVGTSVACGEVIIRSGDYVTCSEGNRECLSDGTWGDCIGDQITTKSVPPPHGTEGFTRTQAIVGPSPCVGSPCDPYCTYTQDDGNSLTNLPAGICQQPTGGVAICNQSCAYSGAHGATGYANLPAAWKKLPAAGTCTAVADACGYDTDCSASGACSDWAYPCYDPSPPGCALAKKIDLELGPPCRAAGTYHIQVCNRGADRADAGTIKIGIYSSSALVQSALPVSSPATPDKGYITFALGATAGKYIEPGQCLELTPSNSTASIAPNAPDWTAIRGLALNYDKSLSECNYANNWQVFDPSVACTGCTNLQCAQTCASANLTGKIYDPAGTNPVPGVIVYVPNDTVAALTDGVQCDTCSNLYTGTPIASTVTAANGTFTLANVPVGTNFPLVIQIGRWRRQVTVSSISGACGAGTPTAVLPAGETSRLPSKKSEGDIPKMAISMSAGDHLECLLRKIGIEDSEFTAPSGTGRVHLYSYNGMTFAGADCPAGASKTNATCANYLWSHPTQLDKYNAIIAPCDKASSGSPPAYNAYVGCDSASASCPGHFGYSAGPFDQPGNKNQWGFTNNTAGFNAAQTYTNALNYDKPPFSTMPDMNDPTGPLAPDATDKSNLKAYIDKGGRLFSTHWMAHFLTRDTYPGSVKYVYGSYVDGDRDPPDFPYTIDTSSALGSTFSSWMSSSKVTFTVWRHLVESINPPTVRLAYGNSTTDISPASPAGPNNGWGGPMVAAYEFDTPWGVTSDNQCGRVVVAESHVSKSTNPSGNQQGVFLPAASTTCDMSAMTGEEKAFEFLLFSTTQCVGLVAAPPAVSLQPTTFTYDYTANCPTGTQVEWEFFLWQATVPSGTSVVFKAQTADTQAGLATATQVDAGTATANTATWTSDPNTVNWHLVNNSPLIPSLNWLRISMTLNPTGLTTPTVTQWKQVFDCKPAE